MSLWALPELIDILTLSTGTCACVLVHPGIQVWDLSRRRVSALQKNDTYTISRGDFRETELYCYMFCFPHLQGMVSKNVSIK